LLTSKSDARERDETEGNQRYLYTVRDTFPEKEKKKSTGKVDIIRGGGRSVRYEEKAKLGIYIFSPPPLGGCRKKRRRVGGL